jgi:NAD(P)-dependent dehydrogenase (short-subunit alcohol dehydrogenase family)
MGELRFDDRVAIVTGAGRGMGRSHALLLGSRGAKVLVNDLGADTQMTGSDPGPASAVVAEIEAAGGVAAANTDTVATEEGGRRIVADAVDRWGRVDIVIHNAGGGSDSMTIDKVDDAHLLRMFGTHVFGAFHVLGPAWPHMVEQRYGRIVNIASAAAFGLSGQYAYSTAKAGLLGLTKALARDGEPYDIKVNAVLPVAATRLTEEGIPRADLRQWIHDNFTPEQVAAVVVALVHEDVFCSGEAFAAGGGQAARVFYGVSPGHRNPDITIEDVFDHADEIMTTENFILGTSGGEFLGDTGGRTGKSWLETES